MLTFAALALLATSPLEPSAIPLPPPPPGVSALAPDAAAARPLAAGSGEAGAPRADALLVAAFGTGELKAERAVGAAGSGAPLRTFGLALGLLLAAGGAALWAKRHRHKVAQVPHLQVLQVQRVGPKQSLVVAKLGDETLVLGATDGGISLLATRPSPQPSPRGSGSDVSRGSGSERASGFSEALQQATEDQELRAKLARRAVS